MVRIPVHRRTRSPSISIARSNLILTGHKEPLSMASDLPQTTELRTAQIIGPDGKVHYRRPEGDPMCDEATRTPGYSVRLIDAEDVKDVRPNQNHAAEA